MCQLRRFQDGTIKETVSIKVSSWGGYANDFVLDKIVHLVTVHFANVDIQVCRGTKLLIILTYPVVTCCFNSLTLYLPPFIYFYYIIGFKMTSPLYDCISGSFKASKRNKQMRQSIQSFVSLLSECSTPELPIRKVTVAASCLHSGDELTHMQHKASNIPNHFWLKRNASGGDRLNELNLEHQIAEKSKSIPMKYKPVPILMDITVKRSFSKELFTRLAQMHLIQLSHHLHSQNKLNSTIYDGQLIVEYDHILFGITIQEPSKAVSENQSINKMSYDHSSTEGLHERLRTVSSRHSCWWGAEKIVHQWIRRSYLQSTFPEIVADLLLAAILDGSVDVFTSSKLKNPFQTDLLSPASIEATFTRFLYHLSFADFDNTLYFLDKSECHNVQNTIASFEILKKKSQFPLITIVTPFDQTVSSFTKELSDQGALRRIVNCARHSLQQILNMSSTGQFYGFDDLFSTLPEMCLKSYDAVIFLKPFANYQGIPDNRSEDTSSSSLVEWDVVQKLISELETAFQKEDNVMFHYNPEEHNIGIKLLKTQNEDTADLSMLIEDIMIIGKGVVHDVRSLQCNDNLINVE